MTAAPMPKGHLPTPTFWIEMTSPPQGAELVGSKAEGVLITARGTAGGRIGPPANKKIDVKTIEIQLGSGTQFVPVNVNDGNWSFSKKATIAKSGPLKITARLAKGGKSVQRTVNVKLDNTPPKLTFVQPKGTFKGAGPAFTPRIVVAAYDPPAASPHRVRSVEMRIDNGAFIPAHPGWPGHQWAFWNWWHDVTFQGVGSHKITARATDEYGNSTTKTVTVTTVDTGDPAVQITVPKTDPKNPTIVGTWDKNKITVEIEGTASDPTTGIESVAWRVDGGSFHTAQKGPNGWGKWSALIVAHGPKTQEHKVEVRATDGAGNTHTITRKVKAAVPVTPSQDFAQLRAYLEDLLSFATHRVETKANPGGNLISGNLLVNTFHQPFEALIDPASQATATKTVHQLRICIEVLRSFLNGHPKDAELEYCHEAYYSLLQNLGTSYHEIRLARAADPETRQSMAARFGIELGTSRPDPLDRLFLPPDQVTEEKLETLFGLASTQSDPFKSLAGGEPELLGWRRQHLHTIWKQQDYLDPSAGGMPFPVIDPDLVSKSDLKDPVKGNTAYKLWTERQNWVEKTRTKIKKAREAIKKPVTGFEKIVKTYLGATDLKVLATERENGKDIGPDLQKLKLSLTAFLYLVRLHDLVAAGKILDAEWEDAYDILTQVQKLREKYDEWRSVETDKGLTLSPVYFRLQSSEASASSESSSSWRAPQSSRQAWLDALKARIKQEEGLEQELQSAVDATEEATLPLLRDGLIASVDPGKGKNKVDVADWITQRLLIDVKNSGNQKTTRLNQAVQTLQEVLFSVRTQHFGTMLRLVDKVPPKEWVLANRLSGEDYSQDKFDDEWKWMGSFSMWRAAIFVFAYPENYLLPRLRKKSLLYHYQDPTNAFSNLLTRLRKSSRLTPAKALESAKNYLKDLVDNPPKDNEDNSKWPPHWVKTFTFGQQVSEQDQMTLLNVNRGLLNSYSSKKKLTDTSRTPSFENPNLAPPYFKEIFYFVPIEIALQLQKAGQYLAALDWFQHVYAYNLPLATRKIYFGLVLEEKIPTHYRRTIGWLLDGLNPHDIAARRANTYTRFTLMSLVHCFLDFADSEFTSDTDQSVANARTLYVTALDLLNLEELQPPTKGNSSNPLSGQFPSNPVCEALRRHAEVNLFKIHSGRNIAGMERPSVPSGANLVVKDGIPVVDSSGTRPSPATLRPTPYHYAVLIQRAKQLVTLAQQMENNYLSTLEKSDAEAYNLLKAHQDIELTNARVTLQQARVHEAEDSITLAGLQRQRAQIQSDTYQQWIDAGLDQYEKEMINDYKEAGAARRQAAYCDTMAGMFSGFGNIANPQTSLLQGLTWFASSALKMEATNATMQAIAADTGARVASVQASQERRKQEWELQNSIAQQDIQIGNQQILLAKDHTQVATQELSISGIQAEQAKATANFLATKFTNLDLYEWMSGVLGRVYSYFLQQASSMAQLAQNQLAFERQDSPPSFIKADYWKPPSETGAASTTNGKATDRRGLTGSARLLQDIYELDQYAFETDKRKLQIKQVISLAELVPFQFQRFRQTGVLPFNTSMDLFDRAFPGHYLRLIKRVRTSVIALVPPTQGIHAVLTASGVSRVVTEGDVFHTIPIRRSPEMIAFTSPANATGLFELQPGGKMLLPFESMGVDTSWEFRMPRASNAFDYHTIADVLLTIEYTALNSFDYRKQVLSRLDRTTSQDRPFSFRQQFADAWYDLHNADPSEPQIAVQFTTRREDFPPNLEKGSLKVEQLLLYFVRSAGATFNVPADLQFTPKGAKVAVGGSATSVDGVISTRRSNGTAWQSIRGQIPAGTWKLTLPNTADVRNWFKDEQIEDILLVITYSGQTPAWPA